MRPGPGAREGAGPVKTWTHSPTPDTHPSPADAGRRGIRGAEADPSRHPPCAGPGDRGYAPRPCCTLPSATPPPTPRPLGSHLTLLPSLPAATLAGRLYSGRPNSGSREDSKGQAARRLEPCEVRGVGEVLGRPMPAPQSTCVSLTVGGGAQLVFGEYWGSNLRLLPHSPRQALVTCPHARVHLYPGLLSKASLSALLPGSCLSPITTLLASLLPGLPPTPTLAIQPPLSRPGISLKCKSDPGSGPA